MSIDFSKYTVLITGGAGFIGSHLAEYLHQQNAKLFIADNLSTGDIKNIQHLKNIEFIETDINDSEKLKKIFQEIDFVFHLAALGSINRSVENPLNTHLSNATGFLNILQLAKDYAVKGLVYSSSSSVYGDDTHFPKTESKTGKPLSPYAVTKLSNELYAHVFYRLFGLPVIGLRYFNVFGPRQNPNGPYAAVIPVFLQKMLRNEFVYIHGTGEQKRDFTYVDNVVYANILAMQVILQNKKDAIGEVYNVGCHQSISVNEVFKTLSEKLHYTQKPIYTEARKGDIFQSLADIKKAHQLLNYSPLVLFNEGIDKTIEYYKSIG